MGRSAGFSSATLLVHIAVSHAELCHDRLGTGAHLIDTSGAWSRANVCCARNAQSLSDCVSLERCASAVRRVSRPLRPQNGPTIAVRLIASIASSKQSHLAGEPV